MPHRIHLIHCRQGFSLIELLVVISVIAVLASLLLSAVGMVRRQTKQIGCLASQRQIGMAFVAYADDNENVVANAAVIPVSGTTLRWAEIISEYSESRRTGHGIGVIDITGGKSVLTGCGAWKATQVWTLGYGMNWNLARTAQAGVADRTYHFTNRLDQRLSPPDVNVVDFRWSTMTHHSTRLILTDSFDYHTVLGVIDVNRHGQRFNGLFCDLHVQSLRNLPQAISAIDTPDLEGL